MEWRPEYSRYTARGRKEASTPLKVLLEKGLIPRDAKILDFGCGRGADVQALRELGYDAYGYDPYWPPWDDESILVKNTYDVVLCFYVLNVLTPRERVEVLKTIWRVLKPWGKLYVAVRSVKEGTRPRNMRPYLDGYLVKKAGNIEVFQKWYTSVELIEEITGKKRGFAEIEGFFTPPNIIVDGWFLLAETSKAYPSLGKPMTT